MTTQAQLLQDQLDPTTGAQAAETSFGGYIAIIDDKETAIWPIVQYTQNINQHKEIADKSAVEFKYVPIRVAMAAPEMLEALKEIAEGKGPFSRDPLQHASNTIDNMKELAIAAILQATKF